jgi:hypothetical protein
MKKMLIATGLVAGMLLTGCAGGDDEEYYDKPPEQKKTPTKVEQPVRLKVDTYGNEGAEVTNVIIDGTECVIWSTYTGGGGMDCNWGKK